MILLINKVWKEGERMNDCPEMNAVQNEYAACEENSADRGRRTLTQIMLDIRNGMVVLAVSLFLVSLAPNYTGLRAVGYLFGALAYICEIFVLTDCFKVRIPHNELFMPYCFGPLYLIMGVGYLVG